MSNRQILFISYYFPPIHSVESTMVVNILKYLPSEKWGINVVATKYSKERSTTDDYKNAVLDNIDVHRTNTFENIVTRILNRLGLLPDSVFGWAWYAYLQSQELIRNKEIKLIISRSNPITSHFVALYLKKKYPRLPWVAMFGDPWADNPYVRHLPSWIQSWRGRNEKKIIETADKIVVTTESTKDFFVKRHGNPDKFVVLPNTYDPQELEQYTYLVSNSNHMVMAHVGNLYGLRSPEPLFKALYNLKDKPLCNNIKLRLIGSVGEFNNLIKKYSLESIIETTGPVPRDVALREMAHAHVLVLIEAPTSSFSMFLPAKLIEYLAFKKPILGIASKGETTNLINRSGSGIVIDPTQVQKISELIDRYYQLFKLNNLPKPNHIDLLSDYSAKTYGNRLSELLSSLLT